MRSNTSLLGTNLLWIASEMLEILTKIFRIIFNENLFPCSPCDPWIKNTHEPHGAVHGFARGSVTRW